MSTTPAFSPGPCTTSFPRVGRRFRCTLLDLYEQCSLHITLKMPSSVMFGSRPSIFLTRAYSSDVSPCSAAISAVALISVGAVAITLYSLLRQTIQIKKTGGRQGSRRCLCGANQRFDHRLENHEPIGGVQCRFDGALRMRHQASHITFAIADTSDVSHRTIRISGRIIGTVGRRITENDLLICLQLGERRFANGVVAVVMRDGNPEDLALFGGIGKRRIGLLDANVYVPANVAQAG